jgi:hypothetical protein
LEFYITADAVTHLTAFEAPFERLRAAEASKPPRRAAFLCSLTNQQSERLHEYASQLAPCVR